ncbi:MAG TPA: hypothetical protein VKM56_04685 [Verrucomicrobiae bacterium]|nr:hypothetical protein [Verrucomicrobiae bacterium]
MRLLAHLEKRLKMCLRSTLKARNSLVTIAAVRVTAWKKPRLRNPYSVLILANL